MGEKILIVDNDPELCELLRHVISHGDRYEIMTAGSGEDALRFIGQESFALVLADYKLGGETNGLDVLFHAKERDPNVITILMTGFGTDQLAIRAVAEGVYDYLIKPFKSVLDVKNAVERGMRHYLLLKKYNEKVADGSMQMELLKEEMDKARRTREILRSLAEKFGIEGITEHLDE